MALEIFKLVGSVFVDTQKADESLKKTDKHAEGLGKKFVSGVGKAAKWGAGLVTSAGAGAAALLGVTQSASGAMDAIDKGSIKIGISKKAYQEWGYVLGQNGMDISKMEVGMKSLVSSMDGAASGVKSAQERFDALGLSIYADNGTLKDQETMLNETLYALANMENGTEKARLATELFGKAGVELMPMLNGGSEGMEQLTQRAHDLGLVVSDEAVQAGVTLGDTLDDVKQSFGTVINKIGVELMPIVQSGADWVLEHMPTIQTVCSGVFSFIGSAVSWVGSGIQTVLRTIDLAMGNSGVTFGSIMALVQQLFTNTLNILKNIWDVVGKPLWDAIMVIVGAVGDYFAQRMPMIQSAVRTAFTDIKAMWENHLRPALQAVNDFIKNVLAPAFKFVFETVIAPVVDTAFRTIKQLWNNTLKPVFTGILDFIQGVFTLNFKQAFQGLVNAVGGIWNGLKTVVKAPINAVISIINSFTSSLSRIKIPDWIPAIGGAGIHIAQIPYLAEGGILEKGQTGFLEGNGAEAVVPLHNNQKWIHAVAEDMDNEMGGSGDRVVAVLLAILEVLEEISGMKIILDTGALVGGLAKPMDKKLGKLQAQKARG